MVLTVCVVPVGVVGGGGVGDVEVVCHFLNMAMVTWHFYFLLADVVHAGIARLFWLTFFATSKIRHTSYPGPTIRAMNSACGAHAQEWACSGISVRILDIYTCS